MIFQETELFMTFAIRSKSYKNKVMMKFGKELILHMRAVNEL
jgi:hypothetical protein